MSCQEEFVRWKDGYRVVEEGRWETAHSAFDAGYIYRGKVFDSQILETSRGIDDIIKRKSKRIIELELEISQVKSENEKLRAAIGRALPIINAGVMYAKVACDSTTATEYTQLRDTLGGIFCGF